MKETFFSETYAESRRRFLDASHEIGATINSYSVDNDDELAMDVATFGDKDAPTVVTSSGVHGAEGFLGAAVQLALLRQLANVDSGPKVRHVLIHAINPFGFSKIRRFNEDNVDLNRNFNVNADDFRGSPDGYAKLDPFLNPNSPPSRWEPLKLKMLWNICRYGFHSLRQSIACGQYEYPRGLFFGGNAPCRSTQIIWDNCDHWVGDATKVVHLDFHSGLGRFGAYKLLLSQAGPESIDWYVDTFGSEFVETLDTGNTAYRVSGLFGEWIQNHFSARDYRFVYVEYGTYGGMRMLSALRSENRAFHYGEEESELFKSAKAELLECFCPSDAGWRNKVIQSGLAIVDQASHAVLNS